MIEENGLHYHNGYRYTGIYKDGLENGLWTITKTDVLVSTMDFKEGFQDGELKIFNEAGEIICLVVFDKGEMCETLTDIINVKEMMRVLDLSPTDNPEDLWKIGDVDALKECKGEGYLMAEKNKE
jgi:hypothetical protein